MIRSTQRSKSPSTSAFYLTNHKINFSDVMYQLSDWRITSAIITIGLDMRYILDEVHWLLVHWICVNSWTIYVAYKLGILDQFSQKNSLHMHFLFNLYARFLIFNAQYWCSYSAPLNSLLSSKFDAKIRSIVSDACL